MRKPILIVCGVLGVLVGMGFVMPAIAKLNASGAIPGLDVTLLVLGLALTAVGAGVATYGIWASVCHVWRRRA